MLRDTEAIRALLLSDQSLLRLFRVRLFYERQRLALGPPGGLLRAVSLVVGSLAMVTAGTLPAHAIGNDPCAGKAMVSLTVLPSSISLGQSTTVHWDFVAPPQCELTSMRINYRDATSQMVVRSDLSGKIVESTGSGPDRPQSSGTYFVQARVNGSTIDLGGVAVQVVLPEANGRTTVDITQPNQAGLFAQAINTSKALVRIAGDLDLDLSGMAFLRVKPGVEILGDRTAGRAGPRLFTTTFPPILLNIGHDSSDPSDHVHISGIRLDGGESDDPFSAVGKDDSFGININSSQDVEIDHNELLRWRGAAVRVRDDNAADDPAFVGRINRDNADTVKVHDNSIHHNQHPSSDVCAPTSIVGGGHAAGYGVEASDGAYVTIERNVFDWNRHSIAGDGKSGTGYIAQDNLVLQHGGVHFRCVHSNLELVALVLNPFATAVYLALDGDSIYHTHAIDMHAVDTCHNGVFVGDAPDFGDHNCGRAGEFMDIGHNTILYTAGNGIHLRGTPAVEMLVHHNVFAHQDHDGGALSSGAIVQNERGVHETPDNLLGLNTFDDRKSCDFDGDGTSDPFIATGVAWWYASSVLDGRWVFLNRSPVRLDDVQLRDIDGDGRCDEVADGQMFPNRDPQPLARSPGDVSSLVSTPVTVSLSATGGVKPFIWDVSGLPSGLTASPAGHVTGIPAADGPTTSTVTATVTGANGLRSSTTFNWTLTTRVPNLHGLDQGAAQTVLSGAGLRLGNVMLVYNCTDDPGTVLDQSQPAGQAVPARSTVNISVSSLTDGKGRRCHLN
jgi:hypothetical protein